MADINFGILDTQMPGRIAAIPQQQQAQQAQNAMQLMQVQQTMQQNALAKAKMEEYTRGLNEKNTLNQIYNQYYGGQGVSPAGSVAGDASVNGLISPPGMPAGAPSIPSAELARRGLGHMIPAFEEQQLKITKERGAISAQQAKADADRTTAAANKTKALGTGLLSVKDNPTDEALISAFDRMDSTGIDTKPFRAEFAKVTDLNERKKIINNYALTNPEARAALSFVEPKWEKFDLNGKIIVVDTNSNSPTYKQQLMEKAKTLTPYESLNLPLRQREVAATERRVGVAEQDLARKVQGQEPIPPKEIQKREAAYPAATSAVKGFESKSEAFIKDLKALRNHPGLSSITGIAAGRLPGATAEGRAAQAIYDKVVAKGGFQALQDLRDASKTGGALGNVSNQEGKQLTASFAAIDRRQDAPDVQAAIDDAIASVEGARTRTREVYDTTYSYKSPAGQAASPSAPTSNSVTAPNGQTYTFDTPEKAAAFKKQAGIK